MSINFNCSNMIIVRYYGGGSGGEFLKNCLSLSNSAVMSHHVLAELQLIGASGWTYVGFKWKEKSIIMNFLPQFFIIIPGLIYLIFYK